MRKILMVVGVVLAVGVVGCGRKRVKVANTPEGNECRRQCMQIYESCMGARGGGAYVCRGRENECLSTCPDVMN